MHNDLYDRKGKFKSVDSEKSHNKLNFNYFKELFRFFSKP